MTIATVLVVTLLSQGGHDYGFTVPFNTEAACSAAIPAMDPIIAAYPNATVQCIRTRILTSSPLPRAKPEATR